MTSDTLQNQLLNVLSRYFDLGDLRELCFRLDIEFDDLEGDRFKTKAISLIKCTQKQDKTSDLIRLINEMRPHAKINVESARNETNEASLTNQSKTIHIEDNRDGVFFEGSGSVKIRGDVTGVKNTNKPTD